MAAPTAIQWQTHLRGELDACIPDTPECSSCRKSLGAKVGFLFDGWADKSPLRLQYLYAKRSAIDWLLGQLWPSTNATLGPLDPRCKDRFDNLLALRKLTEQAIIADQGLVSHGTVIGDIERLTPIEVEAWQYDPSDRYYRGDPVIR